jgi:hypothetical protein
MTPSVDNVQSYVPKDVSVFSYAAPYGRTPDPSKKYQDRKAAQKASYLKKKAIQEATNKGHKLCTACNEEKSLSDFNVDKKTFTGYSTWCKSCKKDYNKKYLKGYGNDQTNRE